MKSSVLAVLLVSACAHDYVSLGYDAHKRSSGDGMATTIAERPDTGSVAFGTGGRTSGVELRFQRLEGDPAIDDRFSADEGSLELHFVPLRLGPVGTFLHTGPAAGVVFDRMGLLDPTIGIGFRAGGGVELAWKYVGVWVDAAREELTFGGKVVMGRGDRDVVSVGIRVGG